MIIHKMAELRVADDGGLEYVLSDETRDRMGDVIAADGWELGNFKKNPISLFSHFPTDPIGRWEKVRIEGKQLVGRLVLAAKGTSARINEIISLVEQGILRAVSVGFKPIASEPMPDGKGVRYTKQELLECSLVSVPANPAAVQLAKSLNISADTLRQVFGEEAEKDGSGEPRKAGVTAETPRNPKDGKGKKMDNSLSKRIENTQEQIAALRAELDEHTKSLGDQPTDEQIELSDTLNATIERTEKTLKTLIETEQRLVSSVREKIDAGDDGAGKPKVWAAPKEKVEPVDYVIRSAVVAIKAHVEKRPYLDVLRDTYGEDVTTKAVSDIIVNKAAVAPADTTTSAWAGALVQTAIGDFFDLLLPQSVYPGLSAKGGRFNFGRNGTISLPTRDATPTVAGSFVGEGAAIPVRRAGFSAITLTPKKMAVITTMTREITERSTPAIEQLLRNAIQEDTAVSIDSVLLDANAATTIRPAGLRNGITTAAGTAGGGIAAVVADLKGMLGTLNTATSGNLRQPTFLMNPAQALALSLTQNAGGDFPFAQEISQNRFQGYGVIQSTTVPAGVVILLDAADFFTATGDDPRFDVSDQATLHMEDTSPTALSAAGAPNTVAAPIRSLFQTDSMALRMIMPINWAMRRTGVIVERTAVTW